MSRKPWDKSKLKGNNLSMCVYSVSPNFLLDMLLGKNFTT